MARTVFHRAPPKTYPDLARPGYVQKPPADCPNSRDRGGFVETDIILCANRCPRRPACPRYNEYIRQSRERREADARNHRPPEQKG